METETATAIQTQAQEQTEEQEQAEQAEEQQAEQQSEQQAEQQSIELNRCKVYTYERNGKTISIKRKWTNFGEKQLKQQELNDYFKNIAELDNTKSIQALFKEYIKSLIQCFTRDMLNILDQRELKMNYII